MPTTTIRMDDALKARVSAVAERSGKTAHAFLLEAIAEKVEREELDAEFYRVAEERWAKLLATGKSVSWDEAKAYLAVRATGKGARKPAPRKLAR
jgi:predicted transcriptional regulator